MEFFVIAPESEQAPKKGGPQKSQPLNLKVLDLTTGQLLQDLSMSSAHEAAKYCEMFNSRSNIAAKLKRDGYYVHVKAGKILLFTAVPNEGD